MNHFCIASESARMEIKRNVGRKGLNEFLVFARDRLKVYGYLYKVPSRVTPSCHEYHFSSLFICYYAVYSSRGDLGPHRHGMGDASRIPWKHDLLLGTLRAARDSKSENGVVVVARGFITIRFDRDNSSSHKVKT